MCIATAGGEGWRTFPLWWYLREAKLTSCWFLCLQRQYLGKARLASFSYFSWRCNFLCNELWDFPGVLAEYFHFSKSVTSPEVNSALAKIARIIFFSWWACEMPLLSYRRAHSQLMSHLPALNQEREVIGSLTFRTHCLRSPWTLAHIWFQSHQICWFHP